MKKVALIFLAVSVATTLACAQEPVKAKGAEQKMAAQELKLKGVIIDTLCAGAHKEDLGEFVKTHPKSCAIMPDCAASGYGLVSDGVFTKFDAASNIKISEFLQKEGSSLNVEVVAMKVGEELSLISVVNQAEAKDVK